MIQEDLLELWAGERENVDDLDDEELQAYFLASNVLGLATLSCRNSERLLDMAAEAEHIHALAMLPLARKRIPFENGPKKERFDALGKLIVAALTKFPDAGVKDLLEEIKRGVGGRSVIQEIDEDNVIYWHDGRRERQTPFKTFQNRIAKYRKKIALAEIPVSD